MSEFSNIAAMVGENLSGQQLAQGALHDLAHSTASPDLLHERLQAVMALGGHERLRSFMRCTQKRIEHERQ